MKKYAAALLSVFLVCGCSNITPNNEKVEAFSTFLTYFIDKNKNTYYNINHVSK